MTKPKELPQTQPARPSDMVLRLQIGVGGVLVVLLLVGLASIIGQRAADQVASDAAIAGTAPAQAPATEADQPLVELGVQPASPEAEAPQAAPPPAGTAPSVVADLPSGPAQLPPPKKQP